ncbi:MAG: hypothetical protein HY795_16670 [Desulfovibrio sp.]|nr:hypothetical protein [Desulfovibrio sp.]MBI4961556.1 hypothetical protein [Desulfovibrio sp.]
MFLPASFSSSPVTRKNRYASNAKLDEGRLLELAACFTSGVTAGVAAKSADLNRNTVNRYYQMFRDCLTREIPGDRRIATIRPPLVGLFLSSRGVDPRIIPEEHRDTALGCLRRPDGAMEACISAAWSGYDAVGDPGTDCFLIMPGCLIGAYGQNLLRTYWEKLRATLCRSRGIPREVYWQHLAVFELAERMGEEKIQQHLLHCLETME